MKPRARRFTPVISTPCRRPSDKAPRLDSDAPRLVASRLALPMGECQTPNDHDPTQPRRAAPENPQVRGGEPRLEGRAGGLPVRPDGLPPQHLARNHPGRDE